jgi:deoxyribose-phosphate aldolase
MTNPTPINRYIDQAVLKPEATRDEALAAVRLGLQYDVRCICVRPCDVRLALESCLNTTSDVGSVVGFPNGYCLSETKADEAARLRDLGVAEIDMVANYGLIRSGLWSLVQRDIEAVGAVARPAGIVLKVILETSELDLDQIARATRLVADAGADFAKTSTGFTGEGATETKVRIMLDAAAGRIGIKASGGIRDLAAARSFIDMGCTRLGISTQGVEAVCKGGRPPGTPQGEH